MWKEFKEFIARGSVFDLAVGIVIGAAFTAVVNSFVKDLLMPIIGFIFGGALSTSQFIAIIVILICVPLWILRSKSQEP